jgi:hypothetical protein
MNIIVLAFIVSFAWMVVRAFQQDRLDSDSPRDLLKEDMLFIKSKLLPVYRVVLGAAQLVAGIIAAVVEVYSSTQVQDWILTTRRFVSKNAPIANNWAQGSWQRLQHRQTDSEEALPSEAVVTVAAVDVVEDEQPDVTVAAVDVVKDEQTAATGTIAFIVSSSERLPGSLAETETASDSGADTSAQGRRSSRRARRRASS